MAAVYPAAVRTYTVKTDDVSTIDASDVNILQDEVAATQRTIGVNPLSYSSPGEPTVTYGSVAKRLDTHETSLGELQNEINTLSFAASNGWNTPVLSITQSGITPRQLTSANSTNYGPIVWNTPPTQDVGDMWTGGVNLVCVLGGWYRLELTFTAPLDTAGLAAAQNANNHLGVIPVPLAYQHIILNLKINGHLVRSVPSSVPWASEYVFSQHVVDFTTSGTLHQGDVIVAEVGQINGTVTGSATFAATFQRALPGVA